MKISKRLKCIHDMLDDACILADIGCDHAQLCCYAIHTKKAKKAYACDVKEGPLKQAIASIKSFGMEEHVIPVLQDGLDNLKGDVTHIVIAGMGFETIKKIFEDNFSKLKDKIIVVQCNKDVQKFRAYLEEKACNILEERVCLEEDHFYQMIKLRVEKSESLTFAQIHFGKNVVRDDAYYAYVRYSLYKLEQMLPKVIKNESKHTEIQNQMLDAIKILGELQ